MNTLPPALKALDKFKQFMLYKLIPNGAKTTKLPCSVDGKVVDAHDSKYWVDAETACAAATLLGDGWGVAFTFTDDDPFWFIDVDDCLQGGQWSPIAVELCQLFAGAAVEVSQSGRGLHLIGTGSPRIAIDDHACKAKDPVTGSKVGLFDLYRSERFCALTGTSATGDAGSTNHQAALDHIVEKWLKLDASEVNADTEWTTTHCAGSYPIEDDERLIEKALKSESVASTFGARASFKDLWTADPVRLLEFFPPDQGGEQYDASAADLALAQHLSFFTGNNCERILRLMHMSGLKRDKWTKRPEYLVRRTIPKAVSRQTSWYSVGKPIEIIPQSHVGPVARTGFQFVSGTQLFDMFKDCVYVAYHHRILTPEGLMLKPDQFNSVYGGYVFALDDTNEKTTKKAWEAFTESQCYSFNKVFDIIYNPDIPFGTVTSEEDVKYVNAFRANTSQGVGGDVSVFLDHVKKLHPADYDILLDWAAHKVQNPGKCMLWAPVIIGPPGNGKTTIADAMMMVMGYRHSTVVQSCDVDNKFNGWVFGNTFAVINDFKAGDKRDVIEILKPIVTDRTIPYQKKGMETAMCRNMLGIIITSNHKDSVLKVKDDRRYAIFINPHESAEDILRDGMDDAYYTRLDTFMRDPNTTSYLRHYFLNRAVVKHPSRAPYTSTTGEAVEASLGAVEQEVMECIEEGRVGFAGGWVSSMALDALIERLRMGRAIAPRKRRDLMKSIGYDWHPALKDGRVNNHILMDNGKPRLYIRQGHIHANLVGGAEVVRHYEAAQGDPVAIAALSQAVVS
jgi:hypothetical protein